MQEVRQRDEKTGSVNGALSPVGSRSKLLFVANYPSLLCTAALTAVHCLSNTQLERLSQPTSSWKKRTLAVLADGCTFCALMRSNTCEIL